MLFDGPELRKIVGRNLNAIELRNEHGRCWRILSRAEALTLDLGLFVGIGSRVRFLARWFQTFAVKAGSRTSQRLEGEARLSIVHSLVGKHRSMAPTHGARARSVFLHFRFWQGWLAGLSKREQTR